MNSEGYGPVVWVAEGHKGHTWKQDLSTGVGRQGDAKGLAEVTAEWQAFT